MTAADLDVRLQRLEQLSIRFQMELYRCHKKYGVLQRAEMRAYLEAVRDVVEGIGRARCALGRVKARIEG